MTDREGVEAKAFYEASKVNFANAEIHAMAMKMRALIRSPSPDAPVTAYIGQRFPGIVTDATWRQWLGGRLLDLPWVEECCLKDGYRSTVPASGPIIHSGHAGLAKRSQKSYESYGGQFKSGGAAALFALIKEVVQLLTDLLPSGDDI